MPTVETQVGESPELFESRKADHIRLALDQATQAVGGSGLSGIQLVHEALPDLNFEDVSLEVQLFSKSCASPMFVSSMTAGHRGSLDLNLIMARVAEKRNWPMGLGSQRRQLNDRSADNEWSKIRKACPRVRFFGNIGLAQVITSPVSEVKRLAESAQAEAMIVHLNPLQECMQPEGTPAFKGGLQALERLVKDLKLPVIVKETGCGFSESTLRRLRGLGVFAVDVSGYGGTHWGRVEGGRSDRETMRAKASATFADWGIGTVESLRSAVQVGADYQVWASGGVRSGLDAAKLVALGARHVGFAMPVIEAAMQGEDALNERLELFEFEMKTALFCTGARTITELQEMKAWRTQI